MENDDWRITGQEDYLMGKKIMFAKYEKYSVRNHEHCIFCWTTFSEYAGDLHQGYCVLVDNFYQWICPDCFNDFKDKFQWEVVDKVE